MAAASTLTASTYKIAPMPKI